MDMKQLIAILFKKNRQGWRFYYPDDTRTYLLRYYEASDMVSNFGGTLKYEGQ